VLAIRNEHRYEMYDPQIEFAEPLISREFTFEVDERVLADGDGASQRRTAPRSRRWPRRCEKRAWSRSRSA
jgi:N-methylhydantoinase A/oxoprolinase/acetone carboxylase beta subunit